MKLKVCMYRNPHFTSVTVMDELVWHSVLDKKEYLHSKLFNWFESLREEYDSSFVEDLQWLEQHYSKSLEEFSYQEAFTLCIQHLRHLCDKHKIDYSMEDEA